VQAGRRSVPSRAAQGGIACLTLLSLALLWVGCGGDDGGEDDGSGAGAQTTATAGAGAPAGEFVSGEPGGELRADGIGPVRLGMSREQVEELFGPPDRTQEVDFGGGPVAPRLDLVYGLEGGELRVKLATGGAEGRGEVAAYSCESPALETADGYRVGTPFSEVTERYEDRLRPNPIGSSGYLLSAGEPGTRPALDFYVEDGRIAAISGGEVQPAGD
jgi:hypothetical protein